VTAFNGQGAEWTCTLEKADRKHAQLAVQSFRQAPPLPFRISLGQAIPKGTSMDAIVRKATEIGAAEIIPLESERTQVHLDDDRSYKKSEKWKTDALEAAKQCGNPWLPEIQPVQNAAHFIASAAGYDLKLIASLRPGSQSLSVVERVVPHALGFARVLILIGPEGDFTPSELDQAEAAGFLPVTLGPLVLRCETAAVYALSIISYQLISRQGK
jgi:16S rRNA (uracil1498-N3)-methyltransferase